VEYQRCDGGDDDDEEEAEKNGDDDPWWQPFCLPARTVPSSKDSPAEVFPIMVISSPLSGSCLVDRHAIATTIWNQWNNQHHSGNDLCLFLPRLLPTLTDTLYLLADGLATILTTSPVYSEYAFLLHSRRKRKRTLQSSIQDWILEVMQTLPATCSHGRNAGDPQGTHNATPPNLVVVLQDDVAGSNVVKQQFLQTLTSWRGYHGIPISLVVLESSSTGPDGSLSTMLRKAEDGTSGRFEKRVTYLSVPLSENASWSFPDAMALWTQYFLEALQDVPPPLSMRHGANHDVQQLPLLEWTRQSILEGPSCSGVADRFCGMIMEFFSQPGSFAWDSLRSTSNRNGGGTARVFQPSFCAWFCVYEKAQAMLSRSSSDGDQSMTAADKCDALLQCQTYLQPGGQVHFWWSLACAVLPLQVWVLGKKQMTTPCSQWDTKRPFLLPNASFLRSQLLRAFRLVTNRGTKPGDTAQKEETEILSRYLRGNASSDDYGKQAMEEKGGFDEEVLEALAKKIGELVLVINNFLRNSVVETTVDGKDILKGISQMVLDVSHDIAGQLDHWMRLWMCVNPFMKWMNLQDPLLQKKDFEGNNLLHTLNIRRDVVAGLDQSTQKLLGVLQGQMTITKDDWFLAFGGNMEEFCIGVWTLQMIGLVQLKKGSGGGANKAVYEKVSVVWC
jgi:hypothetical protein